MSADAIPPTQLALRELASTSWDIYKKIFNKLFGVVLILAFPLILIHQLTLAQFARSGDQAMMSGFSVCMSLVHLFPTLIVMMLTANQLESGDSTLMRAVTTALCRWFKVAVTCATLILILFLPIMAAGAILSVILASKQAVSPLAMLIASLSLGVPALIYMLTFVIFWMFAPLAAVWRNKWFFSGIRYSFSLVRKKWWRAALIALALIFALAIPQIIFIFAKSTPLMIVVMFISALVMTFVQTAYVTAFYTLENIKKTA